MAVAHLPGLVRAESPPRLDEVVETATGAHFVDGNEVEILRNGVEIFPAMLEAIAKAERYVDFLTYVYWEGTIARKFAHALAERARAGVDVRVLLDGVGAATMDRELVNLMREAGATVHFFRQPVRWKVWQTLHRTHRKILICDGEVAFTGGVGIADEWTGDARDPDEWRETHLRLRGPAIVGLQAAFTGNWVEENPDSTRLFRPIGRRIAGAARVLSMRSTASVGWSDVATVLWAVIAHARRRLRIATAYFVPDAHSVKLLCDAARRGVDVEIVVPGPHNDERACDLAHAAEMEPLLEAGVRVYRYQPTMLHAKVMVCDDLALVGSPNFNHRSLRQDDECFVVIDDERTVSKLDGQFDDDLVRSALTTIDQWERRPWYRRVLEWFSRLFRGQL